MQALLVIIVDYVEPCMAKGQGMRSIVIVQLLSVGS